MKRRESTMPTNGLFATLEGLAVPAVTAEEMR